MTLAPELLHRAYQQVPEYYFLADAESRPYAESPSDQALPKDAPQEAMWRLFLSEEECLRYKSGIDAVYPNLQLAKSRVGVIWQLIPVLNAEMVLAGEPFSLRVEVCIQEEEDEWPVAANTIFSTCETSH